MVDGLSFDDLIPAAPAPASQAAPSAKLEPAPRDPKQRTAGKIYETPKGPLTWTGTGWIKG